MRLAIAEGEARARAGVKDKEVKGPAKAKRSSGVTGRGEKIVCGVRQTTRKEG